MTAFSASPADTAVMQAAIGPVELTDFIYPIEYRGYNPVAVDAAAVETAPAVDAERTAIAERNP